MRINTTGWALAVTALLSACVGETEPEQSQALRLVRSIVIESGTGLYERSFTGTLQSSQATSLSFRVPGTIQSIPVEVGDQVSAGDVLATLDESTYLLEVQRADALLSESQSALRNARAEYERTKRLYENGNSSRSDLDNAQASADSAEASVRSATKALEIAQLDLAYTELTAESECSIASVDFDIGENVQQGSQVFFATCGSQLEVQMDIPESVISRIQKGMQVTISFPAFPGRTYEGLVSEVGVSTISGSTTFPVTAIVSDEGARELKSGLSADVNFLIEDETAIAAPPLVPPFAVGEDQAGRFVYVVTPTGDDTATVDRRSVEIGSIQSDGIEVVQGLSSGTRVVTAGVSFLRDGMEVRFTDE